VACSCDDHEFRGVRTVKDRFRTGVDTFLYARIGCKHMMAVDLVRMRASPPLVHAAKMATVYAGKEAELWEKLRAKYPSAAGAAEGGGGAAGAASGNNGCSANADFEARIAEFYQKHAPARREAVDVKQIAERYAKKEHRLWKKLRAKYGGGGGGAASADKGSSTGSDASGGGATAGEISSTPLKRGTTSADETPQAHHESARSIKRRRLEPKDMHGEEIQVVLLRKTGNGREYRIKLDGIIGRSPARTLILRSKYVSGKHARLIRRDDGDIYVVDLASSNGTFVAARTDDPDSAIGPSLERVDSTTPNDSSGPSNEWEKVTPEGKRLQVGDFIAFGDCNDPECRFEFIGNTQ
jgi:hypothetical protein